MSLVLETLDGSHISVPLVNGEKETQIQQGDVMFKEHFQRLRIARPEVSTPVLQEAPIHLHSEFIS
jgi:hypothetical protein